MIKKSKKGFTLIELVVVASIIALLAGAGIFSYTQFNIQARDAKRKTDLELVRSALELYKSSNGAYPLFGTGPYNPGWAGFNSIQPDFKPYIGSYPTDSKPASDCPSGYLYVKNDAAKDVYTLFTHLESMAENQKVKDPPKVGAWGISSDGYKTYRNDSGGTCLGAVFNYWISNP